MNREEIIKLARQAGLIRDWMVLRDEELDALANFFALVAAAERDTCLQQIGIIVEAEREACAKVCDKLWSAAECAEAIRARGQA